MIMVFFPLPLMSGSFSISAGAAVNQRPATSAAEATSAIEWLTLVG